MTARMVIHHTAYMHIQIMAGLNLFQNGIPGGSRPHNQTIDTGQKLPAAQSSVLEHPHNTVTESDSRCKNQQENTIVKGMTGGQPCSQQPAYNGLHNSADKHCHHIVEKFRV